MIYSNNDSLNAHHFIGSCVGFAHLFFVFFFGRGPLLKPGITTAHKRSLEQGNVFTGVCLSTGGLCDVTSCLAAWSHIPSGGSLSRGVCVRGSLSRGGLCQGDQRGLSRGASVREPPPLHGDERAVRILLECFLCLKSNNLPLHIWRLCSRSVCN